MFVVKAVNIDDYFFVLPGIADRRVAVHMERAGIGGRRIVQRNIGCAWMLEEVFHVMQIQP